MASLTKSAGFSLIEVLVAIGVLVLVMVGSLSANSLTTNSVSINKLRDRANLLAREGMEAVNTVRAANFNSLGVGTFHPVLDSGVWTLAPGAETLGQLSRSITLTSVQRSMVCSDPVCSIVSGGGLTDPLTLKVNVKVAWKENDRDKQYQLNTLITYWR